MKKSLIIIAVAGLSLVSCRKDYSCECTTTTTNSAGQTSTDVITLTIRGKKSESVKACDLLDRSSSSTINGSSQETKCEIK